MEWNWKRILIGGLCAGFVFTIGGMASAFILNLPEAFARFGVEPSAATAALHTGLRFGLGLASVVVYAGMRTGLGPGPWTAVRVGLLIWFVGYIPGSFVLHELGVLTNAQLRLGAWIYRPAAIRRVYADHP
jgi:hypothetical protein